MVAHFPMKLNIFNKDSETERTVEILGDEILIGHGLECDLVLEGKGIEAHHVRIIRYDRRYFLKTEKDEYGDISPAYEAYDPAAILRGRELDTNGLVDHSEFAVLDVGRYGISIVDT